jgi:hypothetical protein
MTMRSATNLMLAGLVAALAVAGCTSSPKPAPAATGTVSAPAATAASGTAPDRSGPPVLPSPTLPDSSATASAPGTRPDPLPAATRQLLVTPVSATGVVSAGYTVEDRTKVVFQKCRGYVGYTEHDFLYSCDPLLAADVCWPAGGGHQVLCLASPWDHTLQRYTVAGSLSGYESTDLMPFGLALADGTHCRGRAGGAVSSPPGRPDLGAAYLCDRENMVWITSAAHGPNRGINTSRPAWTVLVGPAAGPLRTRAVTAAYYPSDD